MTVQSNYVRYGPLGGLSAGIETAQERQTQNLANYVTSLQAQVSMLQMIDAAEDLRLKKKYGEQEVQANIRNLGLQGDEALSRMDELAARVDETRQNIKFGPRKLEMEEAESEATINNLNAEIRKFDNDMLTNASQRAAYSAEVESRGVETAIKRQEFATKEDTRKAAQLAGFSDVTAYESALKAAQGGGTVAFQPAGLGLSDEVARRNVDIAMMNDEKLNQLKWGGPSTEVEGEDVSNAKVVFANSFRQEVETFSRELEMSALQQGSLVRPVLDEKAITVEAYQRAKQKYLSVDQVEGKVYYVDPINGQSAFAHMDPFVRESIERGDVEGIRELLNRLNSKPQSAALLQHMFPWLDIQAIKERGLSGSLFDKTKAAAAARGRFQTGQ